MRIIDWSSDVCSSDLSANGGAMLMVHAAGKGVKTGQVTVKLVFDTRDVEGFKEKCMAQGLKFGATHKADGYSFANAKDPDGTALSISKIGRASCRERVCKYGEISVVAGI